jgi:hypothetical protein
MNIANWRIRKKHGRWRVYQPKHSSFSIFSGETHAQALLVMASMRKQLEAERRV